MKATNLGFATTTVKRLLLSGLLIAISASPALAEEYCCDAAKHGFCICDVVIAGPSEPIDSIVIGGIRILVCEHCGSDMRRCNCDPRGRSVSREIKIPIGLVHELLAVKGKHVRPNVDGQKYDDRDPTVDPRRPTRSLPNIDGQKATTKKATTKKATTKKATTKKATAKKTSP